MPTPRLVYCHCAYAKAVPDAVKREVLRRLSASGVSFDAVPDLCEMSARKDPALARLVDAAGGDQPVRIAACFPRAVRWLFHAAGSPLLNTLRRALHRFFFRTSADVHSETDDAPSFAQVRASGRG